FGANGCDDLGLRIEVDIEECLVTRSHGESQVGNTARGAVAVVARVVRRLSQLGNGHVGTRKVGVPEAEINDVATEAPRFGLQGVDLREHVRWQTSDATE